MRIAIVGGPEATGLAGLDGAFDWGEAATAAPGDVPDADVVVALGDAAPTEHHLTWSEAQLVDGDGTVRSRAAWPVRDDLFAAPPPPDGAGLLVVGDEGRDAGLLEKLAGRGIPFRSAAVPSADDLLASAAVAFPPAPGADGRYVPAGRQPALPDTAFAPLAARRATILPRAEVTFGLLPGVDHLAASTDDDVVQYAAALLAHRDAFALQVTLGAIAAERQRASLLYGRLCDELSASA